MKRKFFILWSAGVVSTLIALPYIFALQHEVIEQSSLPLPLLILISTVQSSLLLAIAVYFGLKLSEKIHLPSLILFEAGTDFKEVAKQVSVLAIPLGIAVALIIKFADSFFVKHIPELVSAAEQIPFWKTLLVAPYGGVVEEILMRLFFVSLFAWLISTIIRTTEVAKNNIVMWTAISVTAILFGLGHLPATATVIPITEIVVIRAILLNGIGGLVFGWLYWKKGLEYAIVAHFTTDIVLHAILPLLT